MLPNVLYSSNCFEISLWPFHPEDTRSLQKIRPTDTIAFEKCVKKKKKFRDTKMNQHLKIFPSAFSIRHIIPFENIPTALSHLPLEKFIMKEWVLFRVHIEKG